MTYFAEGASYRAEGGAIVARPLPNRYRRGVIAIIGAAEEDA